MNDNWEVKKLIDVCNIQYGYAFDSSCFCDDNSYPQLIRIRDVVRGYSETFYKGYIPEGYYINKGDYLIGMDGEFHIAPWQSEKALLNQRVCKISASDCNVDERFIFYKMSVVLKQIEDETPFVTVKHLSAKRLNLVKLPIPPLPEQSRIVEELDLLSNIIEKKRQQLSELDNLAQSIFYDMFGDPVTNEKGWGVKKYREFGKVIGGYAFVSDLFTDDGIPVLKIGNINSGNLKVDKLCFYKYDENLLNYLVYPNDIVISLTGTVGKDDYGNVCVLPDLYNVYYLNQRNAKLDTKGVCENLFLKFLFADYKIKAELTKNSRGVRQANISNNDIYNLSLPLPPLSLQQLFAQKIEAIEKQKALIKQSIAETEELFNSRMDYYFS